MPTLFPDYMYPVSVMFDLWSLLQDLDGLMMVALLDGTIVYLSESVHKHLGPFQVSIPRHIQRRLTHTHGLMYTPSLTRMHKSCTHSHIHTHITTSHTHTYTQITPHHTLTHTTVRTYRFQRVRPDS